MEFVAVGDKVLVRLPEAKEEKTSGGFIMPKEVNEVTNAGVIVSVGKGRLMNDGSIAPLELKVGDTVVFVPSMGADVVIDEVKYVVLRESDVLAVKKV